MKFGRLIKMRSSGADGMRYRCVPIRHFAVLHVKHCETISILQEEFLTCLTIAWKQVTQLRARRNPGLFIVWAMFMEGTLWTFDRIHEQVPQSS